MKVGDLVKYRYDHDYVGIIIDDHGPIGHKKRRIVAILWNHGAISHNNHNEDDLEVISESPR